MATEFADVKLKGYSSLLEIMELGKSFDLTSPLRHEICSGCSVNVLLRLLHNTCSDVQQYYRLGSAFVRSDRVAKYRLQLQHYLNSTAGCPSTVELSCVMRQSHPKLFSLSPMIVVLIQSPSVPDSVDM
eukprot:Sspe_Gene.48576::Locus_25413_Transcript_1_1_Confidence_1.000_Length_4431::g.48576::m.48576